MDSKSEIILYQPDNEVRLEVRLEDETVWLTQAQMAELFQTSRNNITIHINNIFKEQELQKESVCKESLLTATDGKKYSTKFYNLDVIISVGYRVITVRLGAAQQPIPADRHSYLPPKPRPIPYCRQLRRVPHRSFP